MNVRPEYIEAFATVLSTIIAGLFAIIVVIIEHNLQKSHDKNEYAQQGVIKPKDISLKSKKRTRKYLWFILAFTLIGSFAGYMVSSDRVGKSGALVGSFSEALTLPSTSGPTPTLIPSGDLLMEINFAFEGEGKCNDYDKNRLGYEDKRYYILPGQTGFIAVCHENDSLPPQGVLQIKAYPESGSTNFGYGILFGWRGGSTTTTDACIFGIRRNSALTEAVFVDWVAGEYHSTQQELASITLDNQMHTLQVTLKADGLAQGSLDGQYFAEHRFLKCYQGPIGLVAWGVEDRKIYFDDLKLYGLP